MTSLMIDIFVLICGAYVVTQYLYMVRTQELRRNYLIPKEFPLERCKDPKGYIKAIASKQLLFGIAAIICGMISLAWDLLGLYNTYVTIVAMLIFLILCIWYGRASKKAIQEFWK